MFYANYRKESEAELKRCVSNYDASVKSMQENCLTLANARKRSLMWIERVESFINTIANTPKEFERDMAEIRVKTENFMNVVRDFEKEAHKTDAASGGMAAAGIAAGAGVAAFMPSAAMAIATTFGTASTGAAISTLSGAAATNAALAWLGGGTLATGGGGMIAGTQLLALAGPLGWAIGGVALTGSGLLASKKNKELAEKAEASIKRVCEMTKQMDEMNIKVQALTLNTINLNRHIKDFMDGPANRLRHSDYSALSADDQYTLGSIVNSTKALTALLNTRI